MTDEKIALAKRYRKFCRLNLDNPRMDIFDVTDRIRGVCSFRIEALEMMAVYDTVRYLKLREKTEAMRWFSFVYLIPVSERHRKQVISSRVTRCSLRSFCDERTVYRQLQMVFFLYRSILKQYQSKT